MDARFRLARPQGSAHLLGAVLLLAVGCAPIAVKIQETMDRGEYGRAHDQAERWLERLAPEKVHSFQAKKVRRLSAEAYLEDLRERGRPEDFRRFQRWAKRRTGVADLRKEARRLEENTFYEQVTLSSPSPEGFQEFRQRSPGARDTSDSRRREAELALKGVIAKPSVTAYRHYRDRYGAWNESDRAIGEARQREVALAAKQALKSRGARGLRTFRNDYQDWREAREWIGRIRQREVDLLAKALLRRPTLKAFDSFWSEYGDWDELRTWVPKLRNAELRIAWRRASRQSGIDGLAQFRSKYRAWDEAEALLEKARGLEAKRALSPAISSGELEPLRAFRALYSDWAEAKKAVAKARRHEVKLAYRQAKGQVDSLRAFRTFYRAQPDDPWPEATKYVKQAYEEEAGLALLEASASDDAAQHVAFRDQYPEEKWHHMLEVKIAARVLAPILQPIAKGQLPDDAVITHFLNTGLRQKAVKEAARPVLSRLWKLAQRSQRPVAFRLYAALDGDSARGKKAKRQERDLFWKEAVRRHDADLYEQFAAAFPEDDRALIGEGRSIALRKVWRAKQVWPRATVTHTRVLPNGDLRLSVDVKDCEGNLVSGLRRSVFEAYDGSESVKVVDFRGLEEERPLKLMFAIDLSGSMDTERRAVHQAVVDVAETMRFRGRKTGFGLIAFGDEIVAKEDKPTEKTSVFRQWMDALPINSGGANEDSVQALVEGAWALDDQSGERVMVLITDEPLQVNLNGIRNLRFQAQPGFVDAGTEVMFRVTKVLKNTRTRLFMMASDLSHHGFFTLASELGGEIVRVPQDSMNTEDYRRALMYIADKLSKQYILRVRPRKKRRGKASIPTLVVRNMYLWRNVAELPGKGVVTVVPRGGTDQCAEFSLVTEESGVFQSSQCGQAWQSIAETQGLKISTVATSGARMVLLTHDGTALISEGQDDAFRPLEMPDAAVWQGAYDDGGRLWLVTRSKRRDFKVLRGQQGRFQSVDLKLKRAIAPIVMPGIDGEGRVCVLTRANSMRCGESQSDLKTWTTHKVRGLPARGLRRAGDFSQLRGQRRIGFITTARGAVYRSIDGGRRWQRVVKESGERRHLVFIDGPDPVVCASGSKVAICSEDLGREFHPVGRPFLEAGQGGVASVGRDLYLAQGGGFHRLARVVSRDIPSSAVYFDTRSTQFSPAMVPFLDALVEVLAKDPNVNLRVEGHADARGSTSLNEKLAAGRAKSTADYVIAQGVDPRRVETVSFGERMPIRKGRDASSLARNRRVELTLFKPIAPQGSDFDQCGRRQ